MTIYDRIFALANKMATSPSKGEKASALNEAEYLSKEARKRIQTNLSEATIQEQLAKLDEVEVEKDWEKIASKFQVQKKSRISKFYKVAAIALLLLSASYLTYNHIQNPLHVNPGEVTIAPGTDKALLILEDGSQIALSPETTFKNRVAESKSNKLEYRQDNGKVQTVFNYLVVPRGGQYRVQLSDGTEIWLNADTKIKYPVSFQQGKTRTMELLYGEVYLDVSPSTKHQGDAFEIISKSQKIKVLGTQFNLKAYNDEQKIYTTLVEGKVRVAVNGKQAELHPGEQCILDLKTNEIKKAWVEVNYDIDWIRGYFHFKEKPLKEIMQVLSRWYDVDIYFESPDLENVKFSGLLSKKQTIGEILNGIKNTNSISAYEIKNKTVTIR